MGKTAEEWVEEILEFHRTNFGGARMEDPPDDQNPLPDPPKPPDEKQLPQSQVNEIIATRTKEAREKAFRDLAADLGVSIEDAKRIVKERKEADERNQSELERERKLREAAEADRDSKVTERESELHAERADRALIAAGAPDEDEKLARLRGMLTVEVGASREDVKKDVEKLKSDFPALFETLEPPPGRRTSTDPPRGRQPKVSDTAFSRGSERAKERYTQSEGVPRPAIPGVPVPER